MTGDGFMLNLVSVLQLLCAKVKQDKVDPVYLYTDTCCLDTTDDSRLKSTSKEEKRKREGRRQFLNLSCKC